MRGGIAGTGSWSEGVDGAVPGFTGGGLRNGGKNAMRGGLVLDGGSGLERRDLKIVNRGSGRVLGCRW